MPGRDARFGDALVILAALGGDSGGPGAVAARPACACVRLLVMMRASATLSLYSLLSAATTVAQVPSLHFQLASARLLVRDSRLMCARLSYPAPLPAPRTEKSLELVAA